jgi:hypothetical protein
MLSTKSLLKISSLFLLATFFTVDTTLAAKYPNVCSYLIRTASEQDKSRGENVRQIQIALIGDRYADFGIPSGFYGSKTSEAVKFFQAIHGIYPVGSTGPRTLAAMRMAWCSDKDEEAKVETQPVSSANTKNISITLEPKTENNVRKLFWKAVNADACSLNNSKVATSSSKDLGTIMATTSFTLACNNSNASTSKSVSVFPLAKTSVTTADNVDDESATEDDSSSQDDSSSNDSQDYSDDSSDDTSDAGFEDNSEDYSQILVMTVMMIPQLQHLQQILAQLILLLHPLQLQEQALQQQVQPEQLLLHQLLHLLLQAQQQLLKLQQSLHLLLNQ